MLLDLRRMGLTGKELERRLDEVNITANKNAVPNDPEKPFVTSGVRIGTPAVTSRGFKEPEMELIAQFIAAVAKDFDGKADTVRAQVAELTAKYPLYEG
jgi:glycine hydroxymethyltransferase